MSLQRPQQTAHDARRRRMPAKPRHHPDGERIISADSPRPLQPPAVLALVAETLKDLRRFPGLTTRELCDMNEGRDMEFLMRTMLKQGLVTYTEEPMNGGKSRPRKNWFAKPSAPAIESQEDSE